MKVMIGYVTRRAEPLKETWNWRGPREWAAFDPEGMRYGVAGVECSVSAPFFKHMPRVTRSGHVEGRDAAAFINTMCSRPHMQRRDTSAPMDYRPSASSDELPTLEVKVINRFMLGAEGLPSEQDEAVPIHIRVHDEQAFLLQVRRRR